MQYRLISVLIASLFISAGTAWGHGDGHAKKAAKPSAQSIEEKPFGKPGDPKKITRTISVTMDDSMHFVPEDIVVRQGDTIKFVATNKGKIMHEMVLGTPKELAEHAELMRKFPNMEHDEPYMAHVAPGKTQTMVWQFTKAGSFRFACLVAGHMEAGMLGRVIVQPAGKPSSAKAN